MKKTALLIGFIALLIAPIVHAQEGRIESPETQPEQYFKGKIVEIVERRTQGSGNIQLELTTAKVEILSGEEKGIIVEVEDRVTFNTVDKQRLHEGDKVIVAKVQSFGETNYFVADKYRLPPILWILGLFFVFVIIFGRLRGFTSILGLAVSILILALFIVPQILAGKNPIIITLIGAVGIAFISIYLAHGFNRKTSIAVGSTIATLGIAMAMAALFVNLTKLFGTGTEEAFLLQSFPNLQVNLQGLLLAGIIIGTLGVLDDVTTTQTATVNEIRRADEKLSVKELYRRGLAVGHEHIAALVNTLVLAYAGAALPLFLLFALNDAQPLWVVFNSEFVAEEIIRTLVGSLALIMAVPISTFLAAYYLKKYPPKDSGQKQDVGHVHMH